MRSIQDAYVSLAVWIYNPTKDVPMRYDIDFGEALSSQYRVAAAQRLGVMVVEGKKKWRAGCGGNEKNSLSVIGQCEASRGDEASVSHSKMVCNSESILLFRHSCFCGNSRRKGRRGRLSAHQPSPLCPCLAGSAAIACGCSGTTRCRQ